MEVTGVGVGRRLWSGAPGIVGGASVGGWPWSRALGPTGRVGVGGGCVEELQGLLAELQHREEAVERGSRADWRYQRRREAMGVAPGATSGASMGGKLRPVREAVRGRPAGTISGMVVREPVDTGGAVPLKVPGAEVLGGRRR